MSQLGGLLGGIAAILWVLLAIAVAYNLRGSLAERLPFLTKLGVSPSGVSMEFAEAKLDEALAVANAATNAPGGRVVGEAAKQGVLQRLERNEDLLRNARMLWADDHPENNNSIIALLRRFGAKIDTPKTNDEAIRLLQGTRYDVIISDVARDSEGPASDLKGIELASEVFQRFGQKTILFSARFDPATLPGRTADERLEMVRLVHRVVFGLTNYFDEALHLVLDVLERQ
jgi:CheY-like chemotaxis protein